MAKKVTAPAGGLELVPGQIYRRTTLHEHFGGQQQGGISTPSQHPVILLFTGASGVQHGYEDGWSDNVFCYFGEGQIGDMPWVRGNAAIRDHVDQGRDLHLFKILAVPRSHVEYVGPFFAASWEYRPAPDRTGTMRRGIVFHLVPAATQVPRNMDASIPDLSALRQAATQAGADAPQQGVRQALATYYQRSAAIRDYALARANGLCEACNQPAPFTSASGAPFLEVHHLQRLSDGGPDKPDAVAAICPNCHREMHHGQHAKMRNDALTGRIRTKEWKGGGSSTTWAL
ncbi:HNH endonuclease [Pseudoroseomonas sp. WGS1072]|uniref:HNH endonuclease n=1 Tax=Roseomonas sp. WGS1072 TaxID=3366816 RepID=UPI003BEFE29C